MVILCLALDIIDNIFCCFQLKVLPVGFWESVKAVESVLLVVTREISFLEHPVCGGLVEAQCDFVQQQSPGTDDFFKKTVLFDISYDP